MEGRNVRLVFGRIFPGGVGGEECREITRERI